MRTIVAIATTIAACVALVACSLPTVDKEADAKAKAIYEVIRTGGDLAARPDVGAELKTPQSLSALGEAKDLLPVGQPTKIDLRSWSINVGTDGTKASLVHAYVYPSATVLAETVLVKDKGKDKPWTVIGFHLKDSPGAFTPPPAVTVEKARET